MCIIILGCSITGLTLALTISKLSQNKIPIYIIEKEKIINKFNNNNIVLSEIICKYLDKLNIWEKLKKYATPINDIIINEKNSFGLLHFKSKDYFISSLGQVIPLNKIHLEMFRLIKKKT